MDSIFFFRIKWISLESGCFSYQIKKTPALQIFSLLCDPGWYFSLAQNVKGLHCLFITMFHFVLIEIGLGKSSLVSSPYHVSISL